MTRTHNSHKRTIFIYAKHSSLVADKIEKNRGLVFTYKHPAGESI